MSTEATQRTPGATAGPAAPREFRVVGTRPIRHDGIDKVTGRARYGADVSLPGMLHGKVVRSPYAHARIVRIDTSRARALPGVHAIVTGADMPVLADAVQDAGEGTSNPRHVSDNVLAKDKVLYVGHAVAAVAAASPHLAEEAAALVDVEYEVLPPVLDVLEAMRADAPILHEDLRTKGAPQFVDQPTNVAAATLFERGDPAAGFAAADAVVEREFRTAMVHQGYIEPHNAVAQANPDGQTTVWCSTQGAFEVRRECAQLLGRPLSSIKVVPMEIGGGFGGKIPVYLEPLAVMLSERSGRPVKLVMTRAEVLRATGPTSGSVIRVKMGATRDGRITAAEAWLAYEAGAYPGSPVWAGAMVVFAPYDIESLRIEGLDVVVNRPKTAAYRAPGGTNANFAAESVIDELAAKIGMDAIDFRRRNAAREGTRTPWGPKYRRIGMEEILDAAARHPHRTAPLDAAPSAHCASATPASAKRRGRGFAIGWWMNAGLQSSATLSINPDGSASVVTGSTDIGGTRAACAMVAAEELGIDVERVRPSVADTDSIGYTDVTGGSRVAMATGLAVYEAAQDVKRQLRERAAATWNVPVEQVRFEDGRAVAEGNGHPPLSIAELAARFGRTGGPVVGRAAVNAQRATGPSFAALLVDVEVDVETGRVDVLRATVLQDAGRAIHPAYVEGQMQGGTAQGIGWALNEEYVYDPSGELQNAGFLDYRMPVALDLPPIDAVIVEVPNPNHPYGVRGVGEASIVPPPAAVASAIADATGVRLTELPMSPPRVLRALDALRAAGGLAPARTAGMGDDGAAGSRTRAGSA